MLKKIDIYLLRRFSTLLVMTFLICVFILLMQFVWKYFVDLVGKGIDIKVLVEFFVYAAFTVVPLALPLAILLASLMTFGNLGESFELTAMKSAGISLFRIMRSLIFFIVIICVAAFYFSNNILPIAQTKLWTLLYSIRHKSPELEIPVGEFYSGINGYNIYARGKDKNLLKDLMIYDFSAGFNNATIMVADSGRIQFTEDKKYLLLKLYNGESFENLKNQKSSNNAENIPYRRETYKEKEILIDFDSDFNRYDESLMQNQHISKDIVELTKTIDSVSTIVDMKAAIQAREMVSRNYFGRERTPDFEIGTLEKEKVPDYDTDSLFLRLDQQDMEKASSEAVRIAKQKYDNIKYNNLVLSESTTPLVRHKIEWHRKLTLSFACLVFFFIGAPLGAIIRKGGLGMPAVISVVMFVIYYIIDNTGYKMARENLWEVAEGMWLSSAVLLPIGAFLTYKAAVDADLFRSESYLVLWNKFKLKLFGIKKRFYKN